jgi:hypothetical protein
MKIYSGPAHHNPLPEATPDELVRQLLSLLGLEAAIAALRDEQSRRDYVALVDDQ